MGPTIADSPGWAAQAAGESVASDSVPTEEAVDAAKTLPDLRAQEGAIMKATRRHEEVLGKLQTLYKRVRAKMYRDHKQAVIKEDNSALQQFQAGCPKPKEIASKEELDAQAQCMQREAREVDDSDLGLLMRRHLKAPIAPLPAGASCAAFRQIDLTQLSQKARTCLASVGDAKWTAEGLVNAVNASAAASAHCARRWIGTSEARCLLTNKDLIFFGNSVVRRQMYTVLDVLAGPAAHRQLTNFTDVKLPHPDERSVARSWIWDQDNMTRGYHASQMFTVDLATGEHRFSMPHAAFCGLGDSHSVFNSGRLHQWRDPGSGGGTEEITGRWQTSKWAGREWKPLISFRLHTEDDGSAGAGKGPGARRNYQSSATCAPRGLSWAGSFPGGLGYIPPTSGGIKGAASASDSTDNGRRRRGRGSRYVEAGSLGARVRARLLREVDSFFAAHPTQASPHVREWIGNVTVHVEEGGDARSMGGGGGLRGARAGRRAAAARAGAAPNVWLYFPTYHGEREKMNGFCEDKPASECGKCTNELASCHRHPECRNKHVCPPMAPGSAVFVERARAFAAMLVSKGRLLGHPLSAVKLTPFYDDCWANRGRCQGHRPCREPVDQAWTCRATAMYCVGRTWKDALAEAKAWIPSGHPSMSMLYLYDGQTSELLDETFRTWGPQSVGYGADAVIFGPQFGSFHGATAWRHTLGGMRNALRAADACLGRRTLTIFRSPAFNFDPVNTPRQQAAFGWHMRPLVEEAGMVYIDNYPATYDAVFQRTPSAIKFAKNSAFHYLNAGRYLMAQLLLHTMHLLAPSPGALLG